MKTTDIITDTLTLNTDDLNALREFSGHDHDDVCPIMVSELIESMRSEGYDKSMPIIVATADPCGPFNQDDIWLVNGRHRRAAALEIGCDVEAILISHRDLDRMERDDMEIEEIADFLGVGH